MSLLNVAMGFPVPDSVALVGGEGVEWLLLDRFYTARAAGAVNGTLSEPSGHARQTTEPGAAEISISGGKAVLLGDNTAYTNCVLAYAAAGIDLTHVRGKALLVDFTISTGPQGRFNHINSVINYNRQSSSISGSASTRIWGATAGGSPLGITTILRNPGIFSLINGKLAQVVRTGSGAFALAGLFQYYDNTPMGVDDVRLAQLNSAVPTVYPTPVLSDTFSAPAIIDHGDLGLNGTPNRVGLTGTAGVYDGTASYTNIYSAGLNSLFSGVQGTLITRAKVRTVNTWTDSVYRYLFTLKVDASNYIYLHKSTGVNRFDFVYAAGGVEERIAKTALSETGVMTLGQTWDKNAGASGEVKAFYNGAQEGSTQQTLGVWTGVLSNTGCYLGALSTTQYSWDSSIADMIIANTVATPAQMAALHTDLAAGTLTKATLDSIFGAGHYVWYKHTETYQSNGLAHVEGGGVNGANVAWQDTAGQFSNASNKAYIDANGVLGPELLTNGDFSAWTVPDTPDGWTVIEALPNSEVSEVGAGEGHGGAGTGFCNIYTTADNTLITQTILASNNFYRVSIDVNTVVAGSIAVQVPTNNTVITASTSGTKVATTRKIMAGSSLDVKRVSGATDVTFDNVSCKLLPFASLLRAASPASAGEPYMGVKMTITANTQMGGMINLDSVAAPLYGIHWWVDRVDSKLYARKLVNGVWQADSLAGIAVTYSAGAYGEIRRIGDECYIWYGGSYVGSFQAADVPTANTKVALFSTDSASYFEGVEVFPTNGLDYGVYS